MFPFPQGGDMNYVIPIDIKQREDAVDGLQQALAGMEAACSFLASENVSKQLHYTVYIELVKSVSNSAQGIKVCIDMIKSGVSKDDLKVDQSPV
jgi:hypothetical protein